MAQKYRNKNQFLKNVCVLAIQFTQCSMNGAVALLRSTLPSANVKPISKVQVNSPSVANDSVPFSSTANQTSVSFSVLRDAFSSNWHPALNDTLLIGLTFADGSVLRSNATSCDEPSSSVSRILIMIQSFPLSTVQQLDSSLCPPCCVVRKGTFTLSFKTAQWKQLGYI